MTRARHCLAALLLSGIGACAAQKEAAQPKAAEASSADSSLQQQPYGQPGQPPGQGGPEPGYGQAPGSAAPAPVPGATGGMLAPETKTDESFASLEDAEKALEKAKDELGAYAVTEKKPKGSVAPPAKPAHAAARPLIDADPRCENVCKAFASLERAAKGVCRLTKDDDARCVRAKSIVEENRARIAACKCAANGG